MLALVGFIGLGLLVGAADAAVGSGAIRHWYPSLTQPPATPPDWVFGPVWSALYITMGIAAWLVWRRCGASRPLRLWGWQLAANAAWTPFFFGLHNPALALADITVLLGLLLLTVRGFMRVHRAAAVLMLPVLIWTGYAAYLNAGFWWLNRF